MREMELNQEAILQTKNRSNAEKCGRLERPGNLSGVSGLRELGECNAHDLDGRVRLTVAVATSHVFAATELLDDDFLVEELLDDLGGNLGPFEDGSADLGFAISGDKQNFGENDLAAAFAITTIDDDPVSLADAELVTTVFKNRVHSFNYSSEPRSRRIVRSRAGVHVSCRTKPIPRANP